MSNFAYEQAPKLWAEYYGQSAAKALAKNYILGGAKSIEQSIFVTGNSGVGKTVWVRLLIRSMACLDRPDDSIEPCGKCHACLSSDERLKDSSQSDIYWIQPGRVSEESLHSQVKEALKAAAKGQRHSTNPDRDILWVILDEFQAFPSNLRQEVLLQAELVIPNINSKFIFITMQQEKLSVEDQIAIMRRGDYVRMMPYTQEEIVDFLTSKFSNVTSKVAGLIAKASMNTLGLAIAYYGRINKIDPLMTEEVAMHILHFAKNEDRVLLWEKLECRANFGEIKLLIDNICKYVEPNKLCQQLQEDLLTTADRAGKLTDDQVFAMLQLNQFQQHYRTANLLNYLVPLHGMKVINKTAILYDKENLLNYTMIE